MDALANLPADITKHRVLGPKAAAELLGVTLAQLRRMRSEGTLPQEVYYSPRRYGWKASRLISWLRYLEMGGLDPFTDLEKITGIKINL